MSFSGRATRASVELGGIHLPLNFNLIAARWSAEMLRSVISAYEAALPPGAWPNWVLGSHDVSRLVTRIGTGRAGNAYVVDSNDQLIAHPDLRLVIAQRDLSNSPQVKAARAQRAAGGKRSQMPPSFTSTHQRILVR